MDFDFAFVWSPLELSLRVAGAATAVSFVVATLAAWRLARKRGPMPALLDALCSLPLVMPTYTAGPVIASVRIVCETGTVTPCTPYAVEAYARCACSAT